MAGRASLSEMEGAVLGVVWNGAPCTPYMIRKVFQASPSPFWSGSAGAIYPLVARLENRGLLRAEARVTGKRRGWQYRLTSGGLRALRSWIAPPLPEWVLGVPMDGLRTRVEFLEALPPSGREAFLSSVGAGLRTHIRAVAAHCRKTRSARETSAFLASRGALLMLRARRAWLREVRSSMRWSAGRRKSPPG